MTLNNELVIHKAKELGFDLVGFAPAIKLEKEVRHLNEWLNNKFHASMEYMNRNVEKRLDVKEILPSAKSVISLAVNYYTPDRHENKKGFGKISRYAWGKDYHLIIWEKLEELEEELREIDPSFESMSYVDTGPVMDKAWAVRAGIGWMGKHSNVINRDLGSWFFIASIITNHEFDYDNHIPDYCGSCTACIDACPTKAIVKPYVVDASRCISFLTIENKGEIDSSFKNNFDNWLFGCDVCQDVCPWNKKFSFPSGNHDFLPAEKEMSLNAVAALTAGEFKSKFETSPVKRAKLSGLQRNARFLMDEEK